MFLSDSINPNWDCSLFLYDVGDIPKTVEICSNELLDLIIKEIVKSKVESTIISPLQYLLSNLQQFFECEVLVIWDTML